jgi:hypothetical protein
VVLFENKWFRLASQEWSPYRVPNAILRKPPDETESSLRTSRAEIVAAVASLLLQHRAFPSSFRRTTASTRSAT